MAHQIPSFSAPTAPSSRATRQSTEIKLSGTGTNWDLSFAHTEDLTSAINFRRNIDDAGPGLPGTSSHTFCMFHLDGSIRFRDTRSLTTQGRDRYGRNRDLNVMLGAFVEIGRDDFDVLRHEENGSDWTTLIRMRPGRHFRVQAIPVVPSDPPRPLLLRHDMLRLWSRRLQIQSMQYMAIMVRNHQTYVPWRVVLEKEVFGPIARAAAANVSVQPVLAVTALLTPAPLPSTSVPAGINDDEPLIDLFSEELPSTSATANPESEPLDDLLEQSQDRSVKDSEKRSSREGGDSTSAAAVVFASGEPANTPAEETEEAVSSDPFQSVWQHARAQSESGKGNGKGV